MKTNCTRLFLWLCTCALLLSFSGALPPGRYYVRFQMPYLEELTLKNNHSFVFKYSHFENKHDEHKKRGEWLVKEDSLLLKFSDGKHCAFFVSGDELRDRGQLPFKKK